MAVSPSSIQKVLRIGLWGAPGSGKTTFLSALYTAVSRSPLELRLLGADADSTDFLIHNTQVLNAERRFPAGTQPLSQPGLTMDMVTHEQTRRRFGRPTAVSGTVSLSIDMLETPGGISSSTVEATPAEHDSQLQLTDDNRIARLAAYHGIVLFFDPTRERMKADAYEYLAGTLLRMAQREILLSQMPKLPHYVAVCVTKFDDPEIYNFAKLSGYRTYDEKDPLLLPRVHPDDAEQFCRELTARPGFEGTLIADAIGRYFHKDRIRYFITSSIGFYTGSAGRFREQDYQNFTPDGRIRGPVHPINVIEPLVWLGNSLVAGTR